MSPIAETNHNTQLNHNKGEVAQNLTHKNMETQLQSQSTKLNTGQTHDNGVTAHTIMHMSWTKRKCTNIYRHVHNA